MSFLKRFFRFGGKPDAQKPLQQSVYERDNRGTRYDSEETVHDWWGKYTLNPPNFPYIFYRMPSKQDAVNAMLSLPPFKLATDTGKIISTEVLQFGVYDESEIYGKPAWGFFMAGQQITLPLFNSAIASCQKYNGTNPRLSSPPQETTDNAMHSSEDEGDAVEFDFKQELMNDLAIKMYYKARTKEGALEFLAKTEINKELYYIVVSTPHGVFGKDINGIYEQPDF